MWLYSLGRLNNAPPQLRTDAHIQILDTCGYVTFDGRRDFGELIKFRLLI